MSATKPPRGTRAASVPDDASLAGKHGTRANERDARANQRDARANARRTLNANGDTSPTSQPPLTSEGVTRDYDTLADQHDALDAERDALADERDVIDAERDTLADERDRVADERESIADERDALNAVSAHRVINSSALVVLNLSTVQNPELHITDDQREVMLKRSLVHAQLVTDALKRIAKGAPQTD